MELLDFFILRTPFFPLSYQFEDPVQMFRSSSHFRESISISSPSLFHDAQLLIANKIDSEKERVKIHLSLLRYLKRMSFRCTPFGISAGISIGAITNKTGIINCNPEDSQRLIRPDMCFLGKIYQHVMGEPTLRRRLLYRANNTCFHFNNELRYLEYSYEPYRSYRMSSVESDPLLLSLIGICQDSMQYETILTKVVSEGYDSAEASSYICQLIESKLLISELEPSVSGIHYGKKLFTFLEANRIHLSDSLEQSRVILNKIIGTHHSSTGIDSWNEEIVSEAERIGIKDIDIIQVDMLKQGSQIELDREIFADLRMALRITQYLVKHTVSENLVNLSKFIDEFEYRYEGMEVPLLEVMDPHIGIGYPYSPDSLVDSLLTENIQVSSAISEKMEVSTTFNPILRKYYDCLSQNKTEVILSQEDIKTKEVTSFDEFNKYTGIMSSLVSIIKKQDSIKIQHTSTEGTNFKTLGRFCYSHSDIESYLSKLAHLEQEADPQGIFAELVFLPEDRIGNLIAKPPLCLYEIPIVSSSCLPKENQIQLNDILVCVQNGKIQLRSRQFNKVIYPIFSSAYTHTKRNVPLFRFLGDLQYQYCYPSIYWDWGILGRMPFLPRVSYKNIILSKATWKITLESISSLLNAKEPFQKIKKYFLLNKIPNSFVIVQGDHVLPINLDNDSSYRLFIDELVKNKLLVVQENLIADETDSIVYDANRRCYSNEVILLWDNLSSNRKSEIPVTGFSIDKLVPAGGGDCIYFKIYCNHSMADNIIKDHIKPWFDQLHLAGVSFTWFFIRYADPQFHLRIRIFSTEQNILKIRTNFFVIVSVVNRHKKSWKIQEDTYNREWQRYGAENMKNVEEYFYIDSKFVMDLICKLSGSELQSLRWKIALIIVNNVLDDFALSILQKAELMTSMEQSFLEEFGSIRNNKLELSKKFRRSKTEIESALLGQETNLSSVYELLEHRKERIKIVVDKIDKLNRGGELGVSLFNLVSSIIHMSLNRIFESKHRMQEMVIYSFLSCHYKSEIARAKYKITPTR
jgi:thiopeptide-type bacteriocin biosynthesis protein